MPSRATRSRLAVIAATSAALFAVAGCQQGASDTAAVSNKQGATTSTGDVGTSGDPAQPVEPAAVISASVPSGAKDVAVDTAVSLAVKDGTLDSVSFVPKGSKDSIRGAYNASKTKWTAGQLLEPSTRYVVSGFAKNGAGKMSKVRSAFKTQALSLDQQTYANVTPLQGQTVGIAMPVIVTFDVPVTDKAAFEKHMSVTAKPETKGSWNWISDTIAHWRPKTYWQAGTKVSVDVDVNGVNAGNGIYGQESRHVNFKIGQSVLMKISLATDEMKVLVNGSVARTVPITGGKPGYDTRSGIKVISEKYTVKRMDAATVGVDPSSPDYYNIPDVYFAQRVTNSGEFLHAAPWSTYAQGSYNVSHGCVGMSYDNAQWLFGITHIGDPVEVTGSSRGIEDQNGWTDWNESFKEYKTGSALN